MPKLKPDTQRARREHILDAAERCFARAGFHATTMQDICKEAAVSPGALYVYFASKEELIAGICERNRTEFQARFSETATAPDFLSALNELALRYFVDEPRHKNLMCVETGVESTRNAKVGEIYRSVDQYVHKSFSDLFERLKRDGRIDPSLEMQSLVQVFTIIGDGMFWRRAIDPNFDAKAVLPAVLETIGKMLNPVNSPQEGARSSRKTENAV
jgi:AcrR family transcriptional regulator